jgi:hypothetical protein
MSMEPPAVPPSPTPAVPNQEVVNLAMLGSVVHNVLVPIADAQKVAAQEKSSKGSA